MLFFIGLSSAVGDFFDNIKSKVQRLQRETIYTTEEGVEIFVIKGKKTQSEYDFRVKFRQPGKRERTPAHVHMVVEMYVKHAFNPKLTLELRNHILSMFDKIKPINYYPPKLQIFKKEDAEKFKELNKVGEFSVEFVLVVTELIMIQEKTNYSKGSLTQNLYRSFGEKDRFSVIQGAAFGGRK